MTKTKRVIKSRKENPDKKVFLIVASVLILILIVLLIAKNTINFSPLTQDEQISQQMGFDPNQIVGNVEDIRNQYLTQEWSKIIADKPVIGPIHTYFLTHPIPFKIIFNTPYSFTPTFLLVLVLFIYFGFLAKDILSFTAYDKKIAWIVSIIFPIFLAHLNLINITAKFFTDLVLSNDKWWLRWVIYGILVIGLIVLFKVEGAISKYISAIREADRRSELESKVRRSEEFRKGFEEGAGI